MSPQLKFAILMFLVQLIMLGLQLIAMKYGRMKLGIGAMIVNQFCAAVSLSVLTIY